MHKVALGQFKPMSCPPAPSEPIADVDHDQLPALKVPTDAIDCAPSPPIATQDVALTQFTLWRNPLPDASSGTVADWVQDHVPPVSVPTEKMAWVLSASSYPTATHDVSLVQLTSSNEPPPEASGATTADVLQVLIVSSPVPTVKIS